MNEGNGRLQLLSLFREVVLPLADSYLATRRSFRCVPEERSISAGGSSFKIENVARAFLVGAGKAGVPMARAVVDTLREDAALWSKFIGGSVNVYRDQARETVPRVAFFAADHPNPNEGSLEGAKSALRLLEQAGSDDLVIAVISGGGSALLELPRDGITLDEFRSANRALVVGGPTIQEINTVRKHISQVKGGRLRMAAPDSTFITLVLSDVIGDDLSSIASGPCVPDTTSCDDAIAVLERYDLWRGMPESVRRCLTNGDPDEDRRTRLWKDVLGDRTTNVVVASNAVILKALEAEFSSLLLGGAPPEVYVEHEPVLGTVEEAIERNLRTALARTDGARRPAMVVFGGEPVVKVPESATGTGGRMLHYALMAVSRIAGLEVSILASGTDGIDGTSPAAGAVVSGTTLEEAKAACLDPDNYLSNYDSYGFFRDLEARTGRQYLNAPGPTGTNVNDIMLWLFGT